MMTKQQAQKALDFARQTRDDVVALTTARARVYAVFRATDAARAAYDEVVNRIRGLESDNG